MQIVHAIPESRGLLTVETNTDGKITAKLATIDGDPLPAGAEPREVYIDSLSGNAILKVSPSEAQACSEAGEQVAQGHGAVGGWFIDAPDHTVNGRYGDKHGEKAAA
jgi:hypothetical protein